MEFPHHHHHHHHHNETEGTPPTHPPSGARLLSPSHVQHTHHEIHDHHHHQGHEHTPPYSSFPSASSVEHVAHESHLSPHLPPFFPPPPPPSQHVSHETHLPHHPHHLPFHHQGHGHHGHDYEYAPSRPAFHLPSGEDVRIFCEAETDYSLTIRDGSVVLARSNPRDQFQHWIKDEKYSTKVKDAEGFPSFSLVNKATGQALQHSLGATQPVRLTPYRSDEYDESILWTLSRDLGHGFRAMRMVNNTHLNLDAFHGDQNHGGVHDGTVAVLWEWKKGDNQRWKLLPY